MLIVTPWVTIRALSWVTIRAHTGFLLEHLWYVHVHTIDQNGAFDKFIVIASKVIFS